MNKNPYTIAVENALTQIKKICPDISHSFLYTKEGAIVAADSKTNEKTMEKMIHSSQRLAEKAESIGSLKAIHVNGKKGKVILTIVHDKYLALAASKNADTTLVDSVTHVIIPTVLKLIETITPTPLQFATSKQLVVETLSGFFVRDSVQVDIEILEEWSNLLNQKRVDQVEIKAFGGKSTQCKVKEIDDPALKGKGVIRIPERTSKMLEVKMGELVKVKPAST